MKFIWEHTDILPTRKVYRAFETTKHMIGIIHGQNNPGYCLINLHDGKVTNQNCTAEGMAEVLTRGSFRPE